MKRRTVMFPELVWPRSSLIVLQPTLSQYPFTAIKLSKTHFYYRNSVFFYVRHKSTKFLSDIFRCVNKLKRHQCLLNRLVVSIWLWPTRGHFRSYQIRLKHKCVWYDDLCCFCKYQHINSYILRTDRYCQLQKM